METTQKKTYVEPTLEKREEILDVTAGVPISVL